MLLITQKQLEILKQSARKLKKSASIPHHEALECVARQNGFHHWKHVCETRARVAATELASSEGLIAAFDYSEVDGIWNAVNRNEAPFVVDPIFVPLHYDTLFEIYANTEDVDENDYPMGKTLRENWSKEDVASFFEDEILSLTFFRYIGNKHFRSAEHALDLIEKHSFWPPRILWLQGKFINTFDAPAKIDGKVHGIRNTVNTNLSRYGFGMDSDFTSPNLEMVSKLGEIIERYLPYRTKKIADFVDSYGLKHVFEMFLGKYVGNGECILAMQNAGFQCEPHLPNALFNLSKRDYKRLRQDAEGAELKRRNER